MAEPPVYLVLLRRPRRHDPNERRDDPFYEFGSFGCTRCHSKNLLNPRHSTRLKGARLAFAQGGQLGRRLVFVTPPITLRVWDACCEARWTLKGMPFKYTEAPILVSNDGRSDFSLVKNFVRKANRTTLEGKISSLFRSRTKALPPKIAKHVVRVYRHYRATARPSAIASTYDEALPYAPPVVDRNRRATYRSRVSMLRQQHAEIGENGAARKRKTKDNTRCGHSPVRRSADAIRRCN